MSDNTSDPQPPAPAAEPARLHGCLLVDSLGQQVLHVPREQHAAVAKLLLADGYEMCVDLTAVDYLLMPNRSVPAGVVAERFEVVVNLLSLRDRQRIRMRTQVPGSDPSVATLFDLFPGTEAMEREAYDMFGIVFTNHPDLTRILMPEEWDGHPLRKDYDQGRIPVQFSADYSPNAGSRQS
jgi:NADH-quinone oxidoreductase subunit C